MKKTMILFTVALLLLPMALGDYYEDFEGANSSLTFGGEDVAAVVGGSLLDGVYSWDFDTTGGDLSMLYSAPFGSLTPGEPITVSFWMSILQEGGQGVWSGVTITDEPIISTDAVPGFGCPDCLTVGYSDAEDIISPNHFFYSLDGQTQYSLHPGSGALGNDFFLSFTMYDNDNITIEIYDDGMTLLNSTTGVVARPGSTLYVFLGDPGYGAASTHILFDNIEISSEIYVPPSIPTGAVVGGGEEATSILVTLFAMLILIGLVMAVVPMKSLSDQMKKVVVGSALAFTIVIILVVIL